MTALIRILCDGTFPEGLCPKDITITSTDLTKAEQRAAKEGWTRTGIHHRCAECSRKGVPVSSEHTQLMSLLAGRRRPRRRLRVPPT